MYPEKNTWSSKNTWRHMLEIESRIASPLQMYIKRHVLSESQYRNLHSLLNRNFNMIFTTALNFVGALAALTTFAYANPVRHAYFMNFMCCALTYCHYRLSTLLATMSLCTGSPPLMPTSHTLENPWNRTSLVGTY